MFFETIYFFFTGNIETLALLLRERDRWAIKGRVQNLRRLKVEFKTIRGKADNMIKVEFKTT